MPTCWLPREENKQIWGQIKKSGREGQTKMFSKLSPLLQDYRQPALLSLCSRTWKAWSKDYGLLHKMKSKGTAIARVLWVQDEIHCYVHQSSFAAGPSKGYYIANTEERDITICLLVYILLAYGVSCKGLNSLHCPTALIANSPYCCLW